MSVSKLKKTYLQYLSTYPLLTKSITSGIFLGLNETIALIVTGQFQESEVPILKKKVKHVFSTKLLKMIFYGSLIATPVSHTMYAQINRVFKAPLSSKQKLLQILVSLSTVTPALSALYVSWIGIITQFKCTGGNIKAEISNLLRVVKSSLKNNYLLVLRTSLVTSLVSLVVAQKFVAPELWVVFFNFVYLILGTYQNIKMKRAQAIKEKEEKKNE